MFDAEVWHWTFKIVGKVFLVPRKKVCSLYVSIHRALLKTDAKHSER